MCWTKVACQPLYHNHAAEEIAPRPVTAHACSRRASCPPPTPPPPAQPPATQNPRQRKPTRLGHSRCARAQIILRQLQHITRIQIARVYNFETVIEFRMLKLPRNGRYKTIANARNVVLHHLVIDDREHSLGLASCLVSDLYVVRCFVLVFWRNDLRLRLGSRPRLLSDGSGGQNTDRPDKN